LQIRWFDLSAPPTLALIAGGLYPLVTLVAGAAGTSA
jgi:hypothetical protein